MTQCKNTSAVLTALCQEEAAVVCVIPVWVRSGSERAAGPG
jgi:hypothetical protein